MWVNVVYRIKAVIIDRGFFCLIGEVELRSRELILSRHQLTFTEGH